ncbi:MAG: (2Fe-2S)-binding protein [Myxococcales bacterium]|nr:(2Fe-2S)-binding protein [Myxococcales bacterium]
MIRFSVNGRDVEVDVEAEMPLLWVLREELGLRGTKFGCGIGQCGACTVHLDGRPQRSCMLAAGAVEGQQITTIEGLGTPEEPHVVQRAWLSHQVPQCGYCQSGMQMAAAALVQEQQSGAREPLTDADVASTITNLCRCGCYQRIREAVLIAAGEV